MWWLVPMFPSRHACGRWRAHITSCAAVRRWNLSSAATRSSGLSFTLIGVRFRWWGLSLHISLNWKLQVLYCWSNRRTSVRVLSNWHTFSVYANYCTNADLTITYFCRSTSIKWCQYTLPVLTQAPGSCLNMGNTTPPLSLWRLGTTFQTSSSHWPFPPLWH